MGEFKPLDAQRAIRDDPQLKRADKAFLWAAVLRTDNATRKVRASLALLANDSGYRPNAATAIFSEQNLPVTRYFEKIERQPRRLDLWFHPSDRLTVGVTHAESESLSEGVRLTVGVSPTHAEREPSASLCSSSASEASSPKSTESVDVRTESLSDESPSQRQPATAVEGVEMCEFHNSFPADDCRYCSRPAPKSNAPEWKQEQWHGNHLERDEGLDPYGEPLVTDGPATGYRS